MFYTCQMTGSPSRPQKCQVLAITDRPVLFLDNGMYVVNSVREETQKLGFKFEPTHNTTLIHIDSVTHKVKLVPHYDEDHRDTLMCGISMWTAR
jgi:hypothetical protein